MRKPKFAKDETMKVTIEEKAKSPPKSNLATYSIDFLAHLAMSPLCLTKPNEWDRITQEYPDLIRNVSIYFVFNFLEYIISRSHILKEG